jgi:hypothetical protein
MSPQPRDRPGRVDRRTQAVRIDLMSHPDPDGPPDPTPIEVGEVSENSVTGERATIRELPWANPAGRLVAELTALVGARVVGEHQHPAIVERFPPSRVS